MKKLIIIVPFLVFLITNNLFSQDDKVRIGYNQTSVQGGLYNFSNKDKVNIEVNVWGYVKNPGKYIIPEGSTLVDFISYMGGPTIEANLDDIRLFRSKNDSLKITRDELIKLDYKDIFWEEKVKTVKNRNITMLPGDVLIFPGQPKYYFRDNVALIASVTSVLVSVAVLVITFYNYKK